MVIDSLHAHTEAMVAELDDGWIAKWNGRGQDPPTGKQIEQEQNEEQERDNAVTHSKEAANTSVAGIECKKMADGDDNKKGGNSEIPRFQ